MSAQLTIEQIVEDLSLSAEIGSDWVYGISESNCIIAQHFADDGSIDKTVRIIISIEGN